MSTPVVSAIIVNWNAGEMLAGAVGSLLAQDWPSTEIIVVDNASADGSIERLQQRFGERITIIRNARNEGFARGNNIGFAAAKGDWVFLLNPDAVCDPHTITALMEFAEGKPEVGQLACRVVQTEQPNFFDSTGLLLYPDGVCRSRGWQEKDLGQYERPEEVLAAHGCACGLRKAMLDEIGGFDEDFFCYLEDLDLGMRSQLAGWKCWYVPKALVRHTKSSSAGNHSVFKAYHVERNRLYCLWKWMPRFLVVVSPLFTMNRYAMQWYAIHTRQGISADFVKEYSMPRLVLLVLEAWLAALWRMPRMFRKRKEIQKLRKISVRDWYELISRFKLDAIELAMKA